MKRTLNNESGSALIPAMMIISGLAVLVMAMISSAVSGARTTSVQEDDYRLAGTVESIGALAAETIWSGYLVQQGGVADTILSFRTYLNSLGINDSGAGGAPAASEGFDLLPTLALPTEADGTVDFDGVRVDSVRLVRRDEDEETQLWVTVQSTSRHGEGLDRNPAQRAGQQVWSVSPDDFAGFEFALLANNVNCVFCHANIDNVERWFNSDPTDYGSFDRVRVGTLESLHIRNAGAAFIGDADADSTIAGALYTRGTATIQTGAQITDWSIQSMMSREFDATGKLIEDNWGALTSTDFSPAAEPPVPFENLYLDYADDYADMVDGNMPLSFPPPFPDDGGIDPNTGLPDPTGADNRIVDDFEFEVLAQSAAGNVSGGVINVIPPGESIDDATELAEAYAGGGAYEMSALSSRVDGSVMLTGTAVNPIIIDEDVVIDGDLIISGVVQGEGALIVRGNIYVPGDIEYGDGFDENGNRTFGYASNGQRNALGLASGGNFLIGDFQRPVSKKADGTWEVPGTYDIVSGNPDTGDPQVDGWSFALSEMAIFNRAEWSKTQAFLPASAAEAALDPSNWTAANPGYDASHVPRYYNHGDDTIVPLYIEGGLYFDPSTESWKGNTETVIAWDPEKLAYADPTDPTDPFLFDVFGDPIAVTSSASPTGNWITDDMYKVAVEYLEATRSFGKPFTIDGLVYTNNAAFSIVNRGTPMLGRTLLNGALVAADIGLLAPGFKDPNNYSGSKSSQSDFAIGLQLNYDERVKEMLNVVNPNQVTIRRALWDPTIGIQ